MILERLAIEAKRRSKIAGRRIRSDVSNAGSEF